MSDVLEVLARANPIPEAKQPEMEARASELTHSWRLQTAEATPRNHWRLIVVAIAAALGLIVAGTAVAVRGHWLTFSKAKPTPHRISKAFSELRVGAPPGTVPGFASDEKARRLLVVGNNGRTRTFWIAPTKYGGFCAVLPGGGGCEKFGIVPLNIAWGAADANGRRPSDPRVMTQVSGAVDAGSIDSVLVRFADGKTVRPLVTWVSQPIDRGFFSYDVPPEHRVRNHRVTKVEALDAAGNVVTESYGDFTNPPVPPVDALQDEKAALARAQTPEGDAILWRAPTRYGTTCAWVQLGDRAQMVAGCEGVRYVNPSFTFMPTRRSVVVAGQVPLRFDRVELEFADLSHVSAKVVHGFLLYSIPAEHLVAAKQLVALRVLSDDGSTAFEEELTLGLSGCHAPLPTTKTCP
jgi:hypothetical protein